MNHQGIKPRNILKLFLKTLLELQNVDRGSIWVKKGNQYSCVEAMGDESEKIKGINIESDRQSIVGWVIENGEKAIGKAGEDWRHFKEMEEDLRIKSRIIMCFPLILETGEVYGAVQLIETLDSSIKINTEKDNLRLIENIVNICAIAISNYTSYALQLEENKQLSKTLELLIERNVIIGKSQSFINELSKAQSYAQVDFPVLIRGESGTGKELIAREIHRLSKRSSSPYLVQNCSSIPETLLESELFGHKKGAFTGALSDKKGLFESASKGTVFLDEIGDMPFNLQSKILRVIQEGEIKPLGSTKTQKIDVRIVAATNIDLEEAIARKQFREDLFYRLNVLPVHLPPLRERKDDVPLFLDFFIARDSKALGIKVKELSQRALEHLTDYSWKGNIRELENFVRYTIVTNTKNTITSNDLPDIYKIKDSTERSPVSEIISPSLHASPDNRINEVLLSKYSWQELERVYIISLLDRYKWNITKAAKQAGLNRSTFDSRMKKIGLTKKAE